MIKPNVYVHWAVNTQNRQTCSVQRDQNLHPSTEFQEGLYPSIFIETMKLLLNYYNYFLVQAQLLHSLLWFNGNCSEDRKSY